MGNDTKSCLIIEASARIFPRLGYHKTTVEDILKEAGVARSTFYVYFTNKQALFIHVVKGLMVEILGNLETGIDAIIEKFDEGAPAGVEKAEIEDALVELMAGVFRYIDANKGMTRVFLHELVGIDKEMTSLFHGFQESVTDEFEKLMRFGVNAKLLREVNQRRAADIIVGGLIHLARNFSADIGDDNIDEVSREFVEIYLRGLYHQAAA